MKRSVKSPISRTLLFIVGLGMFAGAHAQQADKLELVGYTGYLPSSALVSLSQILGRGVGKSDAEFAQVVSRAQQWLDQSYPNVYALGAQATETGRIVDLQLRLGAVVVDTTQSLGYDESNVRSSLPSLQEGRVLGKGESWLNTRELNQANENPFKQTRVKFEVEPGQAVQAIVQAQSFRTNQSVLSLDNYAGSTTGRERLSYFYTHGNVFGGDEVLRFFGQVGLKNIGDVYGFGASYSMPFYKYGQNILLSAARSEATANNLQLINGGLNLKGTGDQFDAQWTQDLPRWGWGLNDTPRMTLGVSWKKFSNEVTLNAGGGTTVTATPALKETPLHIGLSNAISLQQNTSFLFSLTGSWSKPSDSNKAAFEADRAGSGDGYTVLRYTAGFNTQASGYPISATVLGQYTSDKLIGNNQMSLAGIDAVRGFVDPRSALAGDKAMVARLQVGSSAFNFDGKGAARLYGFIDAGAKSGGSSDSDETVSSLGLGINYQLQQVSVNGFVAQVLKGREENDAKDPSFWLQAQVAF